MSGQRDRADGTGPGHAPHLVLEGFDGPLDVLLERARAKAIDLRRLPMLEVLDQLVAALREPAPLGWKGDWVVMAARLVLLRSQSMFGDGEAGAPVSGEPTAAQPRAQSLTRDEASALASWLDRRPQLGRDVFNCDVPEAAALAGDVVGFLWASLMVFERRAVPAFPAEPAPTYRVVPLDLPSVPEARERIVRLLEHRGAMPLERLLPDPARRRDGSPLALQRRAEIASTFTASLELVKQGVLEVGQEAAFRPVQLSLAQLRYAVA